MSGATENKDGSKKRWKHGKTIVKGEVRFTSVSSLELGSQCLRRWWYAYKQGLKEGDSEALRRGNLGHGTIAQYLTTGDRNVITTGAATEMSGIILAGMHQLPTPGSDLLIEHDMVADLPDGSSGLAFAKLRAGTIPVLGAIDLIHQRPENYGAWEGTPERDEPGVLKLIDHKFVGQLKSAKSGPELITTTQMAGYAIWAFETFAPNLERARLQHNYFPTQGQPRAPSILTDREAVEKTWRRVGVVASSISDAAREANPDLVDASTSYCRAYGRDCPAKSVCRATEHNSLATLIGATAAHRLLNANRPSVPPSLPAGDIPDMTTPAAPTNLIARLAAQRAAANAAPAPTVTPPAPVNVAPTPAPVTDPAPILYGGAPFVAPTPEPAIAPEVLAAIAKLEAEAAAAKQVVEAPVEAPVAAPAPAPTSLMQLIMDIEACGFGFPNLSGAAAVAVAAEMGAVLGADGIIPGVSQLAGYTIDQVAQLELVLAEVREHAAARNIAPTPIETVAIETTPAVEETPAVTAEKKKRGRPAKETTVATQEVLPTAPVVAAPAAPPVVDSPIEQPGVGGPVGITPQPSGAINVFVDCIVDGMPSSSIWPLVDRLMASMNEDAAVRGSDGSLVVTDFRASDPNGRYGFGRWRGVLAALLRAAPSIGDLPPGNYTLDGAMGEIGGVVAETMRQIARATGGCFVKGAR